MAGTPMLPPNLVAGSGNMEGNAAAASPTPGTDMTGICFRDQLWLNTYPLDRNLVFDYFALSPFYDYTCNNEQLRMRSIHPLDISHLS
ncbi:putative transcription regulator MED6 family [Helianthus debilis subsp. tardiflorus]